MAGVLAGTTKVAGIVRAGPLEVSPAVKTPGTGAPRTGTDGSVTTVDGGDAVKLFNTCGKAPVAAAVISAAVVRPIGRAMSVSLILDIRVRTVSKKAPKIRQRALALLGCEAWIALHQHDPPADERTLITIDRSLLSSEAFELSALVHKQPPSTSQLETAQLEFGSRKTCWNPLLSIRMSLSDESRGCHGLHAPAMSRVAIDVFSAPMSAVAEYAS